MKKYCVFLAVMLILCITSTALTAEKGLIGYWNFDDGQGTVAKDSSGNKSCEERSNHTLVRGPEWVDGKFGKALKFDGAQRHKVEVPHSDSFATIVDAVTIEAWVNPANFNPWFSFGVKGDITYGLFINPAAFVRNCRFWKIDLQFFGKTG